MRSFVDEDFLLEIKLPMGEDRFWYGDTDIRNVFPCDLLIVRTMGTPQTIERCPSSRL